MGLEAEGIENDQAVMALGLFGGGIAGTGNICGVLTGGIALISCIHSRSSLDGRENPEMWRLGHLLDKKFRELTQEFGSPNCSDIAQVDWMDQEQVKNYRDKGGRFHYCLDLTEKTTAFLGELLKTN